MRPIDADKLYPDSVSIKGDRLCISQSQIANAPTVCDIEQLSTTRYNNGFYDGAKGMTEKWKCRIEQIRAEIWDDIGGSGSDYTDGYNDGLYYAIDVIDKYTK